MIVVKRKIAKSVWASIKEPKWVTLTMCLAYGLTMVVGAIILRNPPGYISGFSAWITGVMLISAGALGIPSAWRGSFWFEKTASILWIGGYISALFTLAEIDRDPGLTIPIITAIVFVIVILLGMSRLLRVQSMPYAPGRGPLLPEHRDIIEDQVHLEIAKATEARIAHS